MVGRMKGFAEAEIVQALGAEVAVEQQDFVAAGRLAADKLMLARLAIAVVVEPVAVAGGRIRVGLVDSPGEFLFQRSASGASGFRTACA